MTITCPFGIIFIEKAIFGRTKDSYLCPHPKIKDTNCTSTKSEAIVKRIVKRKCDGNSECSINVEYNELGGDHCRGTLKYLEVSFICY